MLSALRAHDVAAAVLDPHEALGVAREAMYREMAGSDWRPSLPGDRVMAALPGGRRHEAEGGVPALAADARPDLLCRRGDAWRSAGGLWRQRLRAASIWTIGPEDPRPFVELAADARPGPHPVARARSCIEGCGQSAMQLKDIGASFLSMFPGNADLRRAFAFLREAREKENHISVRLRAELRDLGAGRGAARSCAGAFRRSRSASRAGATPRPPRSSAIRWRAS